MPAQKCATCAQISGLVTEFKSLVPSPYNGGPVFGTADLTDDNVRDIVLFAQFVNFRTGYSYTWRDYATAAAAAECDLSNPSANAAASQQVICAGTKLLTDPTDFVETETPCQAVNRLAVSMGQDVYRSRTETLLNDFGSLYKAKCLSAAAIEQFTVTYTNKEYHYTLYYYDMAGNLVKTVPPRGVKPDFSATFTSSVSAARVAKTVVTRPHTLVTHYRYNSLNQVLAQNTPDGGSSYFWYDRLGRLAVSQNARQSGSNRYSYTRYDALGRIVEVGQKVQTSAMSQTTSQDEVALQAWITMTGGAREEITETGYDAPYEDGTLLPPYDQSNLRNRVSYVSTRKLFTDPGDYSVTLYSYDIHGNVDKLVQNYEGISAMVSTGNQFKRISYEYDLISGKVNAVHYQPGAADQYHHRYAYDAENRIVAVETSRDNIVWERDAAYSYFKHGPLGRLVLGQQQVQGIDYAYTLQGWLKGMNGTATGDGQYDMGSDGSPSGNSVVARDVVGLSLHYYDEQVGGNLWQDYKAIGGSSLMARPGSAAGLRSLYNGNIGAMSVNLSALKAGGASVNSAPLLYNYQYDQLNRLVSLQAYQGLNTATNQWTAMNLDDYAEAVSYDPNGNIRSYTRNGAPASGQPLQMDQLSYEYPSGNNRLIRVGDAVSAGNYGSDIDDQPTGNYSYDAIGNMTGDAAAGITAINWTVYGKKASIDKSGSLISYGYDGAGNRIHKMAGGKQTVYVRDASGNTMSVYEYQGTGPLKQTEQWMYGSSRLGVQSEHQYAPLSIPLSGGYGSASVDVLRRGEKFFEVSNHLGNVLATVSDRKLAVDAGSDGTIDYYKADVVSAQDYYPFGMLQPSRSFEAEDYRYGFNGKENDNEVKGLGNQQDYGMRIYDPRIGKFLSTDPLTQSYPMLTPYQFASNTPIQAIDIDGEEGGYSMDAETQRLKREGETVLKQMDYRNNLLGRYPSPHTTLSVSDVPHNEFQVDRLQEVRKREFEKVGRNPDGTDKPLTKLAKNETWNNFANNLALPMLEGYSYASGLGEMRGAYTGYNLTKAFEKGGSKLVSSEMLKGFESSSTFGKSSGTFIAPSSEIDNLLSRGLNRTQIANKMGIEDPLFLKGDLIRIDINPKTLKELNLRYPLGTESGANTMFIPGGKTTGGVSEGIVNGIPKGNAGVSTKIVK